MLSRLGTAWHYFWMFFLLPLGIFEWWTDPWWSPYGYILAFWITLAWLGLCYDYVKRGWRFR